MLNTYLTPHGDFSVVSFRIKAHVRLFGWALSQKTPEPRNSRGVVRSESVWILYEVTIDDMSSDDD